MLVSYHGEDNNNEKHAHQSRIYSDPEVAKLAMKRGQASIHLQPRQLAKMAPEVLMIFVLTINIIVIINYKKQIVLIDIYTSLVLYTNVFRFCKEP